VSRVYTGGASHFFFFCTRRQCLHTCVRACVCEVVISASVKQRRSKPNEQSLFTAFEEENKKLL
jgi:hypothetical protein